MLSSDTPHFGWFSSHVDSQVLIRETASSDDGLFSTSLPHIYSAAGLSVQR